jgi:hypothetical protein
MKNNIARGENRELRFFLTVIVNKRWDFFYPIEKAVETASFDFFKHVNSKFQALNKDTNTMTNDKPPVALIEGDYTIMPTKLAEALTALVPLADAICDYADQNCRAFPIATAPKEGVFLAWDIFGGEWEILAAGNEDFYHLERFTHWAPLPPPPTNPPLPAVFVELGQALEKIKGGK